MTDLDRLFRHLVSVLAQRDPARLHQPIALGELTGTILPYRAARRALGVDTSEDYELLVMRLASGERELVATEPETVRARFADEARNANPDLGLLREFRDATLRLRTEPLAYALGGSADERAFAPPEPPTESGVGAPPWGDLTEPAEPAEPPAPWSPPAAPAAASPGGAADDLPLDAVRRVPPTPAPMPAPLSPRAVPAPIAPPANCAFCGGALPPKRRVNFCPHCGEAQATGRCPDCRAEVEVGWRHCVGCGRALEAPH